MASLIELPGMEELAAIIREKLHVNLTKDNLALLIPMTRRRLRRGGGDWYPDNTEKAMDFVAEMFVAIDEILARYSAETLLHTPKTYGEQPGNVGEDLIVNMAVAWHFEQLLNDE